MKFLLLISVISVLTGSIFGGTGNDEVDNGLEVAVKITEALAGGEFTKSLTKIMGCVGPFLGSIGPIVGLITGLIGMGADSAELAFLKKMQARIDNRFDQVDSKLEALSRKIDWSRSQIQFFDFEKNIISMKMELDKLYSSTSTAEFESLKTAFITMYECVYQKSAQMLYEHIIPGSHQFSSNILQEVIKAYDYDRKTIQTFMLSLTKLVLTGSQVEMAYYKLKVPALLDRTKKQWVTQFKNMQIAMEKADKQVENAYKDKALTEAKTIMTDHMGKGNADVATLIYEKLTNKYYWRDWFVVVYKDISGYNNHALRYCKSSGQTLFRFKGFNLLLSNASKKRSRRIISSYYKRVLKRVDVREKKWYGYRDRRADDVLKDLRKKITTCAYRRPIAVGVAKKANVALAAAEGQAYVTKRRNFHLFIFI